MTLNTFIQPPPTFADPTISNSQTGESQFNPIWLAWFVGLSGSLAGLPTYIDNEVTTQVAAKSVNATQVQGSTSGASPAAGYIGQYTETAGSASFTNTVANLAGISLSYGVWEVGGSVQFQGTNTAGAGEIWAGFSTTSGDSGIPFYFYASCPVDSTGNTTLPQTLAVPTYRIFTGSSIAVYLVGRSVLNSGAISANGFMWVRRVA